MHSSIVVTLLIVLFSIHESISLSTTATSVPSKLDKIDIKGKDDSKIKKLDKQSANISSPSEGSPKMLIKASTIGHQLKPKMLLKMENLLNKKAVKLIQKRAKRSGSRKPPSWLLELIMADNENNNQNSIPDKLLLDNMKDVDLPRYFDREFDSDNSYTQSPIHSRDETVFSIFPYSAREMFAPSSSSPSSSSKLSSSARSSSSPNHLFASSSFYDSIHPSAYNFGEVISSEKRKKLFFSPLQNRFKSRFRRTNIMANDDNDYADDDNNDNDLQYQRSKVVSLASLLGDRNADEFYLSPTINRPSRYIDHNWNDD